MSEGNITKFLGRGQETEHSKFQTLWTTVVLQFAFFMALHTLFLSRGRSVSMLKQSHLNINGVSEMSMSVCDLQPVADLSPPL